MIKREIYHIIFNKFIYEGKIRADEYLLGADTPMGKIPQSITIKENKVFVVFSDGDRYVFPYDDKVEYFDREIDTKKKKDESK